MKTRKQFFDYLLLMMSLVFILGTVFLAIFYVPLVPTDVSTVVQSPSDYAGSELRVIGIVEGWVNSSSYSLIDIATPEFKLNVTHIGNLPQIFGPGQVVITTGELTDTDPLSFTSTEVDIGAVANRSAGWVAPYAQKIFYLHVPAAWSSYLAFGIVFITSILFLRSKNSKWDTIARCSAEIGVVLCTLAILTGPIWAKAEWGVYWRWEDPKLLTTFILWLIYLGYIVLRMGVADEKEARTAAVFGIAGFFVVPLSFVSSRVWQSLHPNVIATSSGSMSPEAGVTLLVGVIAFTIMYVYILRVRIEVHKLMEEIDDIKDRIGGIE